MIDTEKHHRRSIHFTGFDYADVGAYFVTICAKNKRAVFGCIHETAMQTNPYGDFARECWLALPEHFAHVVLDEWIVMPNHFHGIVIFKTTNPQSPEYVILPPTVESRDMRARHASPLQTAPRGAPSCSLGAVIGTFKSAVTRQTNIYRQERNLAPVQVWQRNYYERIIRDEHELNATRRYIIENPQHWATDENNPQHP